MFKTEDSLARTKLQELVTVRRADPNRSRTERRSARMANLKVALQTCNPSFKIKFARNFFWGGELLISVVWVKCNLDET